MSFTRKSKIDKQMQITVEMGEKICLSLLMEVAILRSWRSFNGGSASYFFLFVISQSQILTFKN